MTQFMRHETSFNDNVRILTTMILPEWHDKEYKADLEQVHGQAIGFFSAITKLLHRRGFFEVKTKDLGHL